jgi:hypothetical protein
MSFSKKLRQNSLRRVHGESPFWAKVVNAKGHPFGILLKRRRLSFFEKLM